MPARYLTALFIGLPIVELALLLKLHGMVGLGPTVLLVLLTGAAGASLVRRQGLATWSSIRRALAAGNLPAPQLLDGAMILVAGALLVTPGLVTDSAGFALLVPFVRARARSWLRGKLERKARSGQIHIHVNHPGGFQ